MRTSSAVRSSRAAGLAPARSVDALVCGDRHQQGATGWRCAMEAIRWGMIGCGDVAEVKSGPALQKAAGSSVVAVMRRDAAKAADYARRHGVPRHYDAAAALVTDPEVDAIYIATPPSSHLELAML